MRIRTTAALIVTLPALVAGQAPLRVDKVTISPPTTLREIETDKAQPSRLAWSPDGSQLYVQTFEGTFLELNQGKGRKIRHYVFSAADGKQEDVKAEPTWAAEYWAMKSGQASPDGDPWKLEAKETQEVVETTRTPMGGALARGGTSDESSRGAGSDDGGAAAALNRQNVRVLSVLLKGETVGRFENSVMVAGLTYGWGPKGTKAIAFTAPKGGRVILMDDQRGKKEIGGTKDAVLPAWSEDGKKVAWLQKDGKKKFLLQVATVSGS